MSSAYDYTTHQKKDMNRDPRESCNNVAVYGTLKRGFHANSKMQFEGCSFVGKGVTGNTFDMTDCGFPMLGFNNDNGSKVSVEVYHNPPWRDLDWYEGVPSLYTRDIIEVELADGSTVKAWIYVGTELRGTEVIPNSDQLLYWPSEEHVRCHE